VADSSIVERRKDDAVAEALAACCELRVTIRALDLHSKRFAENLSARIRGDTQAMREHTFEMTRRMRVDRAAFLAALRHRGVRLGPGAP